MADFVPIEAFDLHNSLSYVQHFYSDEVFNNRLQARENLCDNITHYLQQNYPKCLIKNIDRNGGGVGGKTFLLAPKGCEDNPERQFVVKMSDPQKGRSSFLHHLDYYAVPYFKEDIITPHSDAPLHQGLWQTAAALKRDSPDLPVLIRALPYVANAVAAPRDGPMFINGIQCIYGGVEAISNDLNKDNLKGFQAYEEYFLLPDNQPLTESVFSTFVKAVSDRQQMLVFYEDRQPDGSRGDSEKAYPIQDLDRKYLFEFGYSPLQPSGRPWVIDHDDAYYRAGVYFAEKDETKAMMFRPGFGGNQPIHWNNGFFDADGSLIEQAESVKHWIEAPSMEQPQQHHKDHMTEGGAKWHLLCQDFPIFNFTEKEDRMAFLLGDEDTRQSMLDGISKGQIQL